MTSVFLVDRPVDPDDIPSDAEVVAVTAAAADALEANGTAYRPLCELADGRSIARLEPRINELAVELGVELERYIAEHHEPARFSGPGFLWGQAYYLHYALGSIAMRTLYGRAVLDNLQPSRLIVLDGDNESAPFALDGYDEAPWTIVLRALAQERGIEFHAVPAPARASAARPARIPFFARRVRSALGRARAARSAPSPGVRAQVPELEGLRLLVVDNPYDWRPALDVLQGVPGTERHDLGLAQLDGRHWAFAFEPTLSEPWRGTSRPLPAIPAPTDTHEQAALERLFDTWLLERGTPPVAELGGIDLWPGLAPHLRALAAASPALARHSDAVAEAALDLAHPHAVCTFAMPWLAMARLAHQCRRRGIPVLCYQHGGTYGTHENVHHELTDFRRADVFLSYGEGIKPRTRVFGSPRARFVAVGSTRLDAVHRRRSIGQAKPDRSVQVLFVAEPSFENSLATFVVEDTERYRLERDALAALASGAADLRVTYRPFPGPTGSLAAWIARNRLGSVKIDDSSQLPRLIQQADLVVTDISSATTWNEALAAGAPLLLYCDPRQTPMADEFESDLSSACHWCRTPGEFRAAVSRLAADPHAFVAELSRIDPSPFLAKYVLAGADGRSVERVLALLGQVRNGRFRAALDHVSVEGPATSHAS
jgi:hypothetical protein